MLARIMSRAVWKYAATALVLALGGAWAGAVSATTVATFAWVATGPGPVVTPSGTLTLSLPDSITTQTFDTGTLANSTAAFAMLTGLSYTYGNGLSVGLSDLTSESISPIKWYTSAATNTSGLTGIYLLAGFQLAGSKVFPGDVRAANFGFTSSAGTQNGSGPSIIGPAFNGMTPFAGQGVATTDSGFWQLTSFQTGVAPVPVPAALPLLLSGLAGLGGVVARRRAAGT